MGKALIPAMCSAAFVAAMRMYRQARYSSPGQAESVNARPRLQAQEPNPPPDAQTLPLRCPP